MAEHNDAGDRMETRRLYVVSTRHEKTEPERELTAMDVLMGWSRLGDGRVCQDGHDTGLLHDLTAKHILTWLPQPGDTIAAIFEVHFSFTDGQCESAFYLPYTYNDGGYVLLICETVLGRPVMLGEDTADEECGHDAVREHVEKALAGWHGDRPCEFSPRLLAYSEDLPNMISIAADEAVASWGRNI